LLAESALNQASDCVKTPFLEHTGFANC